eukprot:6134113-Pyramimonas_sp.AAC.1
MTYRHQNDLQKMPESYSARSTAALTSFLHYSIGSLCLIVELQLRRYVQSQVNKSRRDELLISDRRGRSRTATYFSLRFLL